MPQATPTLPTKSMQKLFLPKLVALQRALGLVADDVLASRVQKEIPVLGADGAIAARNFLRRKGR